jgi:hypothetical protein
MVLLTYVALIMILELFSMWLVWSIIVVPQLTEMIIHCCNVFLSCFMTSSNISVEPICWVLPWCYVFILSKTVALWNLQGKIIIIFLHQRPLFMFICNFFLISEYYYFKTVVEYCNNICSKDASACMASTIILTHLKL